MKPRTRLLVLALTTFLVGSLGCVAQQAPKKKRKKPPPAASAEQSKLQTAFSSPQPVPNPPPVKIISRTEWGAKDPVSMMMPHRPTALMIHHTALRQAPSKTIVEQMIQLQKFSQREGSLAEGQKKPAWPDVPYHFYITANGDVAEGRNIGFVGDTNTEYDTTGQILVTLEGNFELEQPTAQQMDAAIKLVVWLAKKYHVPPEKITGHKDASQTACPGVNLYKRLDEFRAAVKSAQP